MAPKIRTALTDLFGLETPILLAGMGSVAGPELAAAVTNAGGMGCVGGIGYSPNQMRDMIKEIKENLKDKNAPFGVDLLLPKVGEGARKTNYDYTKGKLDELVEIIIQGGAKLFISAVGIPPKHVVDRFHQAGVYVMNMVGAPKHVPKALEVGCDIICAQGTEAGGHTGSIPTGILVTECVKLCKGKKDFKGQPVQVIAAGGIGEGAHMAAALTWGATGVWVGTRFVAAEEAGASKMHQDALVKAKHDDTIRTLIFTGRPLRVYKTQYVNNWETNRQDEIKQKTGRGDIPVTPETQESFDNRPWLMGDVSAIIKDVLPAKTIVDNLTEECINALSTASKAIAKL